MVRDVVHRPVDGIVRLPTRYPSEHECDWQSEDDEPSRLWVLFALQIGVLLTEREHAKLTVHAMSSTLIPSHRAPPTPQVDIRCNLPTYSLTRRTPQQSQLATPMPHARHAYLTALQATKQHSSLPAIHARQSSHQTNQHRRCHPYEVMSRPSIFSCPPAWVSWPHALNPIVASSRTNRIVLVDPKQDRLTLACSRSPEGLCKSKIAPTGCSSSRTAPNCLFVDSDVRGPGGRLDRAWRQGHRLDYIAR